MTHTVTEPADFSSSFREKLRTIEVERGLFTIERKPDNELPIDDHTVMEM